MGAPTRHGAEFSCSDPARRHAPDFERTVESGLYGTVTVRAWTGLHQKLGSTGRWASWPRDQQLPIVRGTVLPVAVARRPRPGRPGPALEGLPAPLRPRALPPLRQVLPRPGQRTPEFGGSHRPVGVPDHRGLRPATPRPKPRGRPAPSLVPTARPGQTPQSLQGPPRLPPTPRTIGTPADAPKPARPGPGRPKGSKNRPKSKRPPYRKSEPATTEHTE
jgi:hypothetical protein